MPPTFDPQELHQNLQTRKMWGKEAAKPTRSKKPAKRRNTWRFAGVVEEKGKTYMLVEKGGSIKRYPDGAELPDGSKILALHEDRADLFSDGKKRILLLYDE